MTSIARTAADLTAEWMTQVLKQAGTIRDASVASLESTVIGTGQLGQVVRVELAYDREEPGAPRTLIAKLASANETSRATGTALGVYEVEVRFYQQIARTVELSVPRCHFAEVEPDTGWFTLLFDDVSAHSVVGDMTAGGTPEQAAIALTELAKLQAPRWDDPALRELSWLADPARTQMLFGAFPGATERFLEQFAAELTPQAVALVERVVPKAVEWVNGWSGPFVVQHGDYRLDNMMFGASDVAPPVTVVDWQTVRLGPPLVDASFYLGGCLSREERRQHERDLLREYHAALEAGGVQGYSWEQCWEDHRRYCLYGVLMAVGTWGLVEQTERGDRLFLGAARQYADLALDLEADRLVAS
jgi:hypothetical protein